RCALCARCRLLRFGRAAPSFDGVRGVSQCEEFKAEVDAAIGPLLARIGAVYERFELDEPAIACRLFYRTRTRELVFDDSRREGDVNCRLRDIDPPGGAWITVWGATGYGEGLSDEELVALVPEFPLSYRQM